LARTALISGVQLDEACAAARRACNNRDSIDRGLESGFNTLIDIG
jgi:hypothetical protein